MKKNLIYFIYYSGEKSFYLEKNLELINRYLFIFDKVICKVATDSPDVDTSFINIPHIRVQNNPETGERNHFLDSLSEVDPDSICFYSHAKGVSKGRTKALDNWIASLYFFNLDDPYRKKAMSQIQAGKSFSGILGKLLPCPPEVESPWHYSGTFFWFNPKAIPPDLTLPDTRYAIESLPGLCSSPSKSHFQLYYSKVRYYLYNDKTWVQILKNVDRNYLRYFSTFFGPKKAIYSCLFGDWDELNPAPKYLGWDAVLFTDKEPKDHKGWDVRIVKNELTPQKESRRYKLLSHIYLSEYNMVCYIDANMILTREPPLLPVWYRHISRTRVFDEAKKIIEIGKDSREVVMDQMKFYTASRYKDVTVMQNGFFVRNHNDRMNKLMERSWEIVKRFSYRDQLALPFACHELRYMPEGFVNMNRVNQFVRLRPHLKVNGVKTHEKVNVHHITPGRSDKNFGKAINQLIEGLPENDWICLRDIDTVPAYHEKFIEQCETIANNQMGFDLIGCMTNRLGLEYQLVPKMFNNWDIQEHRKVAKELSKSVNIKPLMQGQTVGGLMMLFSKSTWLRAGKFPEGGIKLRGSFLDYHFSQAVAKFGRMGIAEGIYLIHLYRIEAKDTKIDIKHLV